MDFTERVKAKRLIKQTQTGWIKKETGVWIA